MPLDARELFLSYSGFIFLFLFLFFFRRRNRSGMRLRLKSGKSTGKSAVLTNRHAEILVDPKNEVATSTFHRRPQPERPLNVMFNYNGHSWDAYEVLGLPAGSSPEKVEVAYQNSIESVEAESRQFIEAAHRAILAQWHQFHKASGEN